jgi:hypothetical protein
MRSTRTQTGTQSQLQLQSYAQSHAQSQALGAQLTAQSQATKKVTVDYGPPARSVHTSQTTAAAVIGASSISSSSSSSSSQQLDFRVEDDDNEGTGSPLSAPATATATATAPATATAHNSTTIITTTTVGDADRLTINPGITPHRALTKGALCALQSRNNHAGSAHLCMCTPTKTGVSALTVKPPMDQSEAEPEAEADGKTAENKRDDGNITLELSSQPLEESPFSTGYAADFLC